MTRHTTYPHSHGKDRHSVDNATKCLDKSNYVLQIAHCSSLNKLSSVWKIAMVYMLWCWNNRITDSVRIHAHCS